MPDYRAKTGARRPSGRCAEWLDGLSSPRFARSPAGQVTADVGSRQPALDAIMMSRRQRLRFNERPCRQGDVVARVVFEKKRRAALAAVGTHRDGRGAKTRRLTVPSECPLGKPDEGGKTTACPTSAHAAMTVMDVPRLGAARPPDRAAQASAGHHHACRVTMRASSSAWVAGDFAFLIRGRFSAPASKAATTAS